MKTCEAHDDILMMIMEMLDVDCDADLMRCAAILSSRRCRALVLLVEGSLPACVVLWCQ